MIIKHSRAEAVLQLGMGRRVGFVTTLRVCTGKDLVPSRMKKAKWSPSSVPCCQKTFKPSQGGNRYPFQKLRENRLQCCPSSPLQHGCFVKAYKTKLFWRSSVFCLLTLSAELLVKPKRLQLRQLLSLQDQFSQLYICLLAWEQG